MDTMISPHCLDSLWSKKFRQQCASNWRENSRKKQTRAWHPRRHWLQQGPRYRNFTITRYVKYLTGAGLEAVAPPEIPWNVAWREAARPPTFEPRHLWNLVLPPATPATLPLPCSPSPHPPPTFFEHTMAHHDTLRFIPALQLRCHSRDIGASMDSLNSHACQAARHRCVSGQRPHATAASCLARGPTLHQCPI